MDNMRDEHDFVTVDKARLNRCLWCGTIESKTWIKSEKPNTSGYYCSTKCELADAVYYRRRGAICCSIFGVLSIAIGIAIFSVTIDLAMPFIIAGGMMLLFYPCLISDYRAGLQMRKIIPKGSRRDNRSLKILILKKAQTTASCPKCGGNIDLTEIGPKRIFECGYCGVEGILEWPHEEE